MNRPDKREVGSSTLPRPIEFEVIALQALTGCWAGYFDISADSSGVVATVVMIDISTIITNSG